MKEHFRKLGEIHKHTGIAFWANVESFTWEKPETNSRQSALVPASFCRYLSQLEAVSAAGAERILSFSIHGIYDKPGSSQPLGQPVQSNAVYSDYNAWRDGDPKWKLLEHIFSSDVVSAPATAQECGYSALCDGVFGKESTADPGWVSFPDGRMSVTLDLGKKTKIVALAAKYLHYSIDKVSLPAEVTFSLSNDGKHFCKRKTVKIDPYKNDLHDCWTDIALSEFSASARYIKVEAATAAGKVLMCDEILVNPEAASSAAESYVDLTLVPPGEISDTTMIAEHPLR